jgi:hypothetical protein
MKKFAIEIKWGIRYIFAYIAWVFLEKYTGVYAENIDNYLLYSLLFYVFAFFIYLLAIKDKKESYFSNDMDWKRGCISGIYLTIVIAILMPFAQIIIHKSIAPEFLPNMMKRALASKNAKPDAIKAYFNLSDYIWQSVFLVLSLGVVYSAIASQFLKTKVLKKL